MLDAATAFDLCLRCAAAAEARVTMILIAAVDLIRLQRAYQFTLRLAMYLRLQLMLTRCCYDDAKDMRRACAMSAR